MTIETYIARYIDLCSKLCFEPEDYTKSKVKRHNLAKRALIALDNELGKDIDLSEKVYSSLLDSREIGVRLVVGIKCLSLNLLTKEATDTLEQICKDGTRMVAMGAERALKIWRGETNPDEPF